MKSKFYILGVLVTTLISTTACSYNNKKSSKISYNSRDMSLPPTLNKPQARPLTNIAKHAQKPLNKTKTVASVATPVIQPGKNYYIVVGTYPNNDQALDMFIKMSSLGFTNTAMETRTTKQGKSLHMVRLGPFNKKNDIDKTKGALSKAGMTQFRIVEN